MIASATSTQQKEIKDANVLTGLGEKIFLDRYALKDMTRETLGVGDTVVVLVDPKTNQREIGTVTKMTPPNVDVELRDGNSMTAPIEHVDKPLETNPGQMMDRIARGIAAVEKTEAGRVEWQGKFRTMLEGFKFVPAGRILTAAGSDQQLTFYNCMPPDQEVLTASGYKPIGDVKVGDRVVTHRNRLRHVTAKFERETEESLYIISPKKIGYDQLRVTGEHKIFSIRSEWVNKHRSRDGLHLQQEPAWIPAKDLKPGDYLAVAYNDEECPPQPIRLKDYLDGYATADGKLFKPTTRGAHGYAKDWGTHFSLNETLTIDSDLCFLFGRWLGDGCITHRTKTDIPSGIKIVFALDEREAADEIARIIESKFGIAADIKLSSTGRWYDLWVNSMPMGQFFKNFLGCYSYGKEIPDELMHLPKDLTLHLLRGLFSADGYTSGNKLGILLANRTLTVQVHQMLLRLGYLFSIKENTHRLGRTPAYRLQATANECGTLFDAFFNKVAPSFDTDLKYYFEHDGLRWVRIDQISVEHYSGTVMDIEVEEDHSFVSAGVVVSNCYVIPSPKDSRSGIIATLSQMTEIMSRGGGVGINLSSLRPKHNYVRGVNGRSSGSVSWGALYSFVTGLIEQGGSRRGALMLILNDTHPDVFDFISSKRTAGKITNANISVGVSDALMDAVKADADWHLEFPDTGHPDYNEVWDGDLEAWRASGRPVILHKTVKARAVWNAVIESAWASAEPGIFFRDRYNKMSNSHYFAPIICTNPCHAGSNLIHTREGLLPIRDLVGKEFEVVSDLRTLGGAGVQYERAVAYATGVKQLYKVKLATGQTIELTANHKVFTTKGKMAVEDLKPEEDAVLIQSAPHLDALLPLDEQQLKQGQMVGWNAGDGWVSQFPEGHDGTGVAIGFIFNKDEELARDSVLESVNTLNLSERPLSRIVHARQNQGCWEVVTSHANTVGFFKKFGIEPKTRKQVTPEIASAPIAFRIGFLQGLFSSDGSVSKYRNSLTGNIILVTVNKSLAEGTQLLLADLGIKTYLRMRSVKNGVPYTTQNGEVKTSKARMAYTVRIAGAESVRRFAKMVGFAMSTGKQAKLDALLVQMDGAKKSCTDYWSEVVSIEPTSIEPVFNLTTEVSHTLVANGMVVSNCGEQGLPAWGVCNLGAINLAKFYDAAKHDVQWDELGKTVRYSVRFLDNVIDATPYFFDENRDQQGRERRVGLNTMGVAELMIRLGIRYGSDESVAWLDKLYEFIASHSYEASIDIAKEKGPFTAFDATQFNQSGFMQSMPAKIREEVARHGIRNVTLLTQAPNGTIGTMVDTSTGIEPFFSWTYYRKSRLGLHEQNVPLVDEWLQAHPGQPLPDYFVTAMSLTPEEHVRVQAAIQRWVDSSISKTCNVPNNYSVDDVRKLYEFMYDSGCKGGTIYRDGSRDEQVLMLKEEKKAEKVEQVSKVEKVETKKPAPAVAPLPMQRRGITISKHTPLGTVHTTSNHDENGEPFEVFTTIGKAGSDLQADAEAMGRLISLLLRIDSPVSRRERLGLIVSQLEGIGGARSVGFGINRVASMPDALAATLREMYFNENVQPVVVPSEPEATAVQTNGHTANGNGKHAIEPTRVKLPGADLCPECGMVTLVRSEGCKKCETCGYSEC